VKQTERLNGLLSRLKDLFLVETGGMRDELQLRSTPLETVVGEVVRGLAPRLEERRIEVEERYPRESVPVLADGVALSRVVEMVLTNACVYSPEGSRITVLVAGEETHARVVVADQGPGIPPEDLTQVFERFQRGSAKELRNVEGEGLGLYLARQILFLMDGTIVAESEPGTMGTTVEITLRVPEEEA
jgi:signal transduction histidine kinase